MINDDLRVTVTLRDSSDGEVSARQVFLGYEPIILIEPVERAGTDLIDFKLDATDIEGQDLASILVMLAHTIMEAENG